MNIEDRVALLLGRAVMRAESLAFALEQSQARIDELELEADKKVKKDA